MSASWFRGIQFYQYDAGFIGGLIISHDGIPVLEPGYRWTFSIQEMKRPLIEIVTKAGWDWKPVVTFSRLLNG